MSAHDRQDLVTFSMDAVSLFPNLRVNRCAEVVRWLVEETTVEFKGLNTIELSRYLAVNLSAEQVVQHGLCDLVMKRKTNMGRKPTVTGNEMFSYWDETESCWIGPVNAPDQSELKKMLAVAVMFDVERVMTQHTFRFRGKFYLQEDGGSIGSELTGEIAKTRVLVVLRKIKSISMNVGLRVLLLGAFVDDVSVAMRGVEKGQKFSDGSIVFCEDRLHEDADLQIDEVSAKLFAEIANSLEDDVSWTFDTPSRNEGGKMPVLDMVLWSSNNEILFEFYEKNMTCQYVILRNSALSWQTKKTVLARKVCRRFLNTCPSLVAAGQVEKHVDKFAFKMMISRYSQVERDMIIQEGTTCYNNIVNLSEEIFMA